jgi:hypothetical protein
VLTSGENIAERGPVVVAGGALGYVAIGIAAVRPESRVTHFGLYWVWFVFFFAYLPRALQSPFVFGPAIALLLASLLLRAGVGRIT